MSEAPRELPPALASLAAVLELSQGFALCFVTGPRDHRDSVWLRLVRALGDRFELRRHRLDRDGMPQLADLAGGADDRPSVVFLSGLENMPDEPRQDITARLNLVRDAWAPHPARVIFWLPAWGLAEFRRLAPDLFHWRSNLTVLHDADLPVRDELEYLVWACERHRGLRSRVVTFRDETVVNLASLARIRFVFVGFDTNERQALLRILLLLLGKLRLHEMLAALGPEAPDLDLLTGAGLEAPASPLPAPLLLRAADLAGRTGPEPDWTTLAEAAGIPGVDAAAAVLADLGARGQLLVLLDGIDQLDLGPDSPGERLVNWLTRENPTVGCLAMTLEAPPAAIARSFHVLPRPPESPLLDTLVDQALSGRERVALLLQHLFPNPEERQHLTEHLFGSKLAAAIPTLGTPAELARALVDLLERHGLLDAAFFEELKRLRPSRAGDIDAAARAWLGA